MSASLSVQERAVLKGLRLDIDSISMYIHPTTKDKLQKTIDLRLLDLLYDAAPE